MQHADDLEYADSAIAQALSQPSPSHTAAHVSTQASVSTHDAEEVARREWWFTAWREDPSRAASLWEGATEMGPGLVRWWVLPARPPGVRP